jgi:hypothetical protein
VSCYQSGWNRFPDVRSVVLLEGSFPCLGDPLPKFPAEVRMISRFVYVSNASQDFTKADLRSLLQEIRQKNTELGVTGMLLYKDGSFMQVVEGEQEVVARLLEVIQRDSRHTGFQVILHALSEERLFSEFSMGFRDLREQSATKTPGYSDFMNTPLTDADFSECPSRCMKLMLLFKKNM